MFETSPRSSECLHSVGSFSTDSQSSSPLVCKDWEGRTVKDITQTYETSVFSNIFKLNTGWTVDCGNCVISGLVTVPWAIAKLLVLFISSPLRCCFSLGGTKEGLDPKASSSLRSKVLKLFEAAPTKYQRAYPPVSSVEATKGLSFEDLVNVKEKLFKLFKIKGIDSDQPSIDDFLACFDLEDEIRSIIKGVFPKLGNLSLSGRYPYGNSYSDQDIMTHHPVVEAVGFDKYLDIEYTENGKPLILQQATRGCTAAVAAMLIHENGGEIDSHALATRDLGDEEYMKLDIERAGLKPKETLCHTMKHLEACLSQDGPAIVTVSSGIGGHVVVVDAITSKAVRLRDPYHGWEVSVHRKAFERSWGGLQRASPVIQVETVWEARHSRGG